MPRPDLALVNVLLILRTSKFVWHHIGLYCYRFFWFVVTGKTYKAQTPSEGVSVCWTLFRHNLLDMRYTLVHHVSKLKE